ncbi:MAG: hypothetical protein C5B49_09910 [Bdellovibrio sp.]|nr:MAG: hypothetical protein C5B49_09910 [Bdellovibrio sp.]
MQSREKKREMPPMSTPAIKRPGKMLSELLVQLERAGEVTSQSLVQLLARFPLGEDDLLHWISFSQDHYVRTRVHLTPNYEIFCCCWLPGQFSPIHDHFSSAAAIQVIKGTATETLYQYKSQGKVVRTESRERRQGTVYGEANLIHELGNAPSSSKELVTLHVYFPPFPTVNGGVYEGGRVLHEWIPTKQN